MKQHQEQLREIGRKFIGKRLVIEYRILLKPKHLKNMIWFLFLSFFKIFAVLATEEGLDGEGRRRRNAYFDIVERDDFVSDYDSLRGIPVYDYDLIPKMKTFGKPEEEKLKTESPLKNLFLTRMKNTLGRDRGKENAEIELDSERPSSLPSNGDGEILSSINPYKIENKESLFPVENEESVEYPTTSNSDSASIFMNPKLVQEQNLFSTKEKPFNYDISYDFNVDTRHNGKNLHAYKTNSDHFLKRSARHVRSTSMKLNSCHSQHLERCGSTLIKKFESVAKESVKCKLREEFLDCMVQERERKCQPPQENYPPEGINSIRSKVKNLLWSAHGCLLF